jgi:hypothetical protein
MKVVNQTTGESLTADIEQPSVSESRPSNPNKGPRPQNKKPAPAQEKAPEAPKAEKRKYFG